MNNGIYINVEGLNASINQLKEIIKDLNSIVENQKSLIERLFKAWDGTTGEKVNHELDEHLKEYDNLLNTLNEKYTFLETVRNSYVNADSGISTKIDENAKV